MWGKLGGNDWNAALAKIGNAVAPPPGEEEDDYDEEYEDEDEYDDDDDDNENEQQAHRPTGFGFVGLLARALEPNPSTGDEEESESPTLEDESLEPSNTLRPVQMEELPGVESVLPSSLSSVSPQPPVEPPLESPTPKQELYQDNSTQDEHIFDTPLPQQVHDNHRSIDSTQAVFQLTTDRPRDTSSPAPVDKVEEQSISPVLTSHDEPKKSEGDQPIQSSLINDVDNENEYRHDDGTHQPLPQTETTDTEDNSNSYSNGDTMKQDSVNQLNQALSLQELESEIDTATQDVRDAKDPSAQVAIHEQPTFFEASVQKSAHPLSETAMGQMTHSDGAGFAAPSGTIELPLPDGDVEKDNHKDILLQQAEAQILQLQRRLQQETEKSNQFIEKMMIQFQEKEARLLQASSEEYQHELAQAEHRHQAEMHSLEMRLANEKNEFVKGQHKLQQLIDQSSTRAERAELELKNVLKKHESQMAQVTNQEQRAVRIMEDKLAQTMALLDDRDEEISRLKQTVKKLESSMNEHEEGVEEAEQEVEELQNENEALQEQVEHLEAECKELKDKIVTLEGQARELGTLQMELTMLREERDRERAKNQSMVQSTLTSHSQLESERDAALADVRDLKQQLTAALADLDIARADQERILTANTNLQSALEAFQDERQAEMSMIDEQRLEAEEAIKSAHAAAMEALNQTHATEIRKVQSVADARLKEAMGEVNDLKTSLNKLKSEHLQTRRSLDEAIHRLQTTQEDVIDRTLMKNILIDWCTMKDKDKRHQVLQLMASVLHFSEQEKESVHLTHLDIDTVRSRVVGALAAPLPPPKAKPEDIKGDNVSEKWISFLLTETDDDI